MQSRLPPCITLLMEGTMLQLRHLLPWAPLLLPLTAVVSDHLLSKHEALFR